MFQRGRLDHFAFWPPSQEASREIRRRLESEARPTETSVTLRQRGSWAFTILRVYVDVIRHKPGVPDTETLRRADWKTVDPS
jgi:hypothetical protein